MASEKWDEEFFAGLGNAAQLGPLVDAMPGAFFFAKDSEGRFTAMNPALFDALGMGAADEVLGRTDYDFFDRDLADAYREEDLRVMESGEPVANAIWWVPNVATGDIQWYWATKVPLSGQGGQAIGVAGIMRELGDATELTADHRQMTAVAEYIERNYAERLTVADLAEIAKLSSRQFQRVFKRVFRSGPIEHLNRVRIRVAGARLVETSDSLSDIAIECGFYDQSHFTNLFRRFRGMTPSKYRKAFASA